MDVAEYDTNTLLINNISSIAFRIYEPVVSQASSYTFAASEVENALRKDGHLVYADAVRRGFWCFHLTKKDGSTTQLEPSNPRTTLDICGYTLGLAEEGSFEPNGLLKTRQLGSNPIDTPKSSSSGGSGLDSSQRSAQQLGLSSSNPSNITTGELDNKLVGQQVLESKGYASLPIKEIHAFFVSALLASLSRSFCSEVGAIPLNMRTVLLPWRRMPLSGDENAQEIPPATLADFRVYLTTAGSLVINLCVSVVHGLIPASDIRHSKILSDTPALMAPLGAFATPRPDLTVAENSLVKSPNTQAGRIRHETVDRLTQWRRSCLNMLEMRGILPSTLDGSPWIAVQSWRLQPKDELRIDGKRTPLLNAPPSISWPSTLCFQKPTNYLPLNVGRQDANTERVKFDPLASAQSWYQGTDDRGEMLSNRKTEGEGVAVREAAEIDGRNQQTNGYSPIALRRSSNPGPAVGTMYPTPPDGVQIPVGATPSFDGNGPSPGQQTAAATLDIDTGLAERATVAESFGEVWHETDSSRERPNASFLPDGENLFDEIGQDMFGETDITDADFNFFDEQPTSVDLDMTTIPDIGSSANVRPDPNSAAGEYEKQDPAAMDSKPPDAPASPKFAKPELRHARSTLAEDSRQQINNENYHANMSIGLKRHPSPFNPDAIYKRIKGSVTGLDTTRSSLAPVTNTRRASVFGRVDFDPSISLVNRKYLESGQFNCSLSSKDKENRPLSPDGPATASYLRKPPRPRKEFKELPSNIGVLIAKITEGIESISSHHSPTRPDDIASDADDASFTSDQDGSVYFVDEPSSLDKSNTLRKRLEEDNFSTATSLKDLEGAGEFQSHNTVPIPRYVSADIPNMSIVKYFTDPAPDTLNISLDDQDLITIAQIITEQAISGNLRIAQLRNATEEGVVRRDLANLARHSMQSLRNFLPRGLGAAIETEFRRFIEVQDVPLLGQPSRMQPRPPGASGAEPSRQPHLFQIVAPHLELRRYDTKLSVLPSAVTFWESLGLGPSQGPKDVSAVCVFPNWEGVSDSASALLDRLRSVYESLKLGNFESITSSSGVTNGLFPIRVNATLSAIIPSLGYSVVESMTRLVEALSALTVSEKNLVVYFVYTPEDPSSIIDACQGFQLVSEGYKKAFTDKKRPTPNELVLQLIPLEFFSSPTSVVVLSPSEYISLCIETYDRCTLFGGPMPAPAIVLEQPVPRLIDFKLTPSENPLHENACIHIAYAQSVDERWVTAAWTDNRGSKQMTASYCLGRKRGPISTLMSDVAHEIWETTHDLISVWRVHWRVVITKCGPMDQSEVEFWIALAQTESKASMSLTLLTVDTNPSLQLLPPVAKIPASAQAVFYTTPVSTPQPATVSPDQSGNNPPTPMAAPASGGGAATATTPGGAEANSATDPDADTVLVDATDTTWGATVLHRLNNSASLVDLSPALASGYLIKRGGSRPEDPPVAMEVSVVHTDATPRVYLYEALLREMLVYFRGLGTLARSRGVADRETDVRPWHVAAAENGVRALYQLL